MLAIEAGRRRARAEAGRGLARRLAVRGGGSLSAATAESEVARRAATTLPPRIPWEGVRSAAGLTCQGLQPRQLGHGLCGHDRGLSEDDLDLPHLRQVVLSGCINLRRELGRAGDEAGWSARCANRLRTRSQPWPRLTSICRDRTPFCARAALPAAPALMAIARALAPGSVGQAGSAGKPSRSNATAAAWRPRQSVSGKHRGLPSLRGESCVHLLHAKAHTTGQRGGRCAF